ECGRNTRTSKLGKIIGGRPADPKDWPWMAALLKVNDSSLICGGVLITDRYVLTAAHCFRRIKVRLGEYDFGRTTEKQPFGF
ncbi:Serine proteinase stubble, partial [Armadillidium vulgare]